MKKMLFMTAIAAVALSSCSEEALVGDNAGAVLDEGAVSFSAYSGRQTRAAITDLNSVKGKGFGVFAYDQGAQDYANYSATNTQPNFFYNQKVACDVTAWQVPAAISREKFEGLAAGDVKSLYTGVSGQFVSSANADAAAIAALTAASLTESDYVTGTVTVTLKSPITAAERIAATNLGANYTEGSGDALTPATPTIGITLDNYLTYVGGAGDLAVMTAASVPYKTPITHEKYNELAESTASALKSNFIADNGANEPKYTAPSTDVTTAQYDALTDAASIALCSPKTFASEWTYAPVKYYDNNVGAQHSFFAYAPYSKDVKVVFANSMAPQIRYTATDDYDLMWGCEWDQTGTKTPTPTTAPMNRPKPSVTEKIAFNFKHALSNVTIKAVPFIDEVHGTSQNPTLHPEHSAYGTLPAGTTVTLRSVKFVGANLPSKALLNLENGEWNVEATEENAYDLTTALTWTAGTPTQKVVMDHKMIIPTDNAFKIQVIYDVVTLDASNPKNNSKVVNTIISNETFILKAGTAYQFHLDLGLTSVKFDAKVVDWNVANDVDIDMPNNRLEVVEATTYASVPAENVNFLGEAAVAPKVQAGKIYFNTTEGKMKEASGAAWVNTTTATLFMNNERIYDVDAEGDCTPKDAPRWITTDSGDSYYILENGLYTRSFPTETTKYNADADAAKKFWRELNAGTIPEGVYEVFNAGGNQRYYVKP